MQSVYDSQWPVGDREPQKQGFSNLGKYWLKQR